MSELQKGLTAVTYLDSSQSFFFFEIVNKIWILKYFRYICIVKL